MPVKVFTLNNVPDDEAEDVRELLRRNDVGFTETSAGNWGISVAAIWLPDERQLEHAKQLIAAYQSERLVRVRDEYARQIQEGRHRTLLDIIKENPLRFLIYLAAMALVMYFSTQPFFAIGK